MRTLKEIMCIGTLVLGLAGCAKEQTPTVKTTIETVVSDQAATYQGKKVQMTGIPTGLMVSIISVGTVRQYVGFVLKGSEKKVLCSGMYEALAYNLDSRTVPSPACDVTVYLKMKENKEPITVTGTYDGTKLEPCSITVDDKEFVMK